MPYVKQERRAQLDVMVKGLQHVIRVDGDLNYVLFALAKRHLEPSYNTYKNFIGELNETVAEIRRRILAPYEDQKIKENGDVK